MNLAGPLEIMVPPKRSIDEVLILRVLDSFLLTKGYFERVL